VARGHGASDGGWNVFYCAAVSLRRRNKARDAGVAAVAGGGCFLAKSTRQLMWRTWALALILIIIIVFGFGSTAVFARGGGHSGGGHGGSHSGGHGGHSGGHRGHPGGHTGDKHGRITSGTTASGHFMNQHRCPSADKTLADCPEFTGKQWQEIPVEKAGNRLESRF
jgi:hypothetical protein